MSDISNVRRNILILVGSATAGALIVLNLVTPAIIHLSPQATREVQTNFVIVVPLLTLLLLIITYVYLEPISQLGRHLTQDRSPPANLAQQARTRAFSAPFYTLLMIIALGGLVPIFINLLRLIVTPSYTLAVHFSYALLVIVTSTAIALVLSSLTRRILQPVLVATADLAEDTGRRYEIRLRLSVLVLSLNFIVFYFMGVLAFNQVYRAAEENAAQRFRQWARDLTRIAPQVSDEGLVTLITESELLDTYAARPTLIDQEGRTLIEEANPNDALALPPKVDVDQVRISEMQGEFVLTASLPRDSGSWQLGVVYPFTAERTPMVQRTLLALLVFGGVVLVLTTGAVYFLADDITRDLQYVTDRLLDIARRGHVGEKVHTLALDEVGDLIAAFDRVRTAMVEQRNELNQRVDQMHKLNQASLALTSSVDFDEILDRICQIARDITASDSVTLYLYNPFEDTFTRASQVGYEAPIGPVQALRPQGMTRTLLKNQGPILVRDTQDHDLVSPRIVAEGIRSLIAVPVVSRAQALGVLYVNSHQVDAYDEEDMGMVAALAGQAAAAIENARLLDETMAAASALEQRARNLLMINRISTDLTSLLDPYKIFNATARHLVQLMDVDHCGVLIFDENADQGIVVAEYPAMGTVGQRLPRADNPAIQRVLETRKPLSISDIHQEPLIAPARDALGEIGVRAILIAPLVARDQVIGTIGLDVLHEPYEFSREEQELCGTIAAQAAIAASNARLLYDLHQQSRALSRKSQELAEESAKLDAVLSNMADGLVVTDLTQRIMLSNPTFKAMAGLPINRSLRGRLLDETFSLSALRAVIGQARANSDEIAVADLELPDGRVLKASASALYTKEEADPLQSGQVTGVVTVLRDITHEVEVDRMKTEFISAVSHELRTPLTSILGFANLIRREFRRRIIPHVTDEGRTRRSVDRIVENLSIIEAESQRLTQLINDLLDIAKMESGRIEWDITDVDVAELIHSAVNTTAVLAEEQDLNVQVDVPTSLPTVRADRDRLVQVLTNLLSNAIKFTEKGTITVKSRVWTADQPDPPSPRAPADLALPALVVSVADTGVGIAKEDLPLVFERFRQVGDTLTEKPKGTGLGLSICKEIVEHQEGRIWAESELGVGSTFYFALPLEPQAEPTAEERSERQPVPTDRDIAETVPSPEGADAVALPTSRLEDSDLILVVDDEPNIRQLLRLELTEAGYQVIEAADGNVALRQAQIAHPDLIILDVLMPGVSGFGVLGELRAHPATADIPIVILSVAEEGKRALELGAAEYLAKPVDVPGLLDTIERLLGSPKPMA